MARDSRNGSPATKDDVAAIMAELGRLYDANERWKDEVKKHFDVAAENIRDDLKAANRERIEVLKDDTADHKLRIRRLEVHAGLTSS